MQAYIYIIFVNPYIISLWVGMGWVETIEIYVVGWVDEGS